MSNNQVTEKSAPAARREKIRIRVDKLRQSRQRSVVVGVAELAGLAGSAVMVLAVLFTYLSFYSPSQTRLATAQRERARLQEKLSTLQKDLDVKGSTQDSVTKIVESLDKFETERLATRDEGRITLYNTLIQLIRSNSLRNTTGPSYTYLDAKEQGATPAARAANKKLQSLYPGIGVTVTVEGQYANLRHFVRDIEASSQFIIINAVELEKAADTDNAIAAPGATPRSTLVSLKIDLAAYFQRDANGETVEQPASETR